MNLAIDPDVFIAAFDQFNCLGALTKIATEAAAHRFMRDQEAVLEREYRSIFSNRFCEETSEHPAIRLLQQILFEDGNSEDEMSSTDPLVERFRELGCTEPVEPVLLGMMANGCKIGLVLMMVGSPMPGIRARGIHDVRVRWQVRKKLPWLDIIPAANTQITLPRLDYKDDNPPHIKAKEDAFESKAAIWLQDQDSQFRCATSPTARRIGGEQIDVYGYRATEDGTTVIIGECKLRRHGNETKLIESGELQQLRRKVIAAQRYETTNSRKKHSQQENLSFEAILITNADGLDDTAKELALNESDFSIRVMRVTLPSDWETSDKWGIIKGEWLLIDPTTDVLNDP